LSEATGLKDKLWASLLWGAALETWAHQLLYTRCVYPKKTFGAARFLGVQCYVNRHPSVVSYIRQTVERAVPALLCGTADQLSLVITCDQQEEESEDGTVLEVSEAVVEEYALRISSISGRTLEALDPQRVPQLERALRDLVLRVHSLPNAATFSDHTPTVSFRLELRLVEGCLATATSFPVEIRTALQDGPGMRPVITKERWIMCFVHSTRQIHRSAVFTLYSEGKHTNCPSDRVKLPLWGNCLLGDVADRPTAVHGKQVFTSLRPASPSRDARNRLYNTCM
jgi:hypothetical protein